ncbi:MAG: pilus assembly protein PilP [Steroidobacteraceae bacterium]
MSTLNAAPRIPVAALLLSVLAAAAATLAGCSSGDDDLQTFITETNKEAGGRVVPLPEVKPYPAYTYADMNLRSPFIPTSPNASNPNLRPDAHRNREFLEQYSLDTMKMVGSILQGGQLFGLVQTKDGLVHRVIVGNYIGQNDGKITAINTSKIDVREIVADGLGGYIERPTGLGLNE